jgi:hypothetical protein
VGVEPEVVEETGASLSVACTGAAEKVEKCHNALSKVPESLEPIFLSISIFSIFLAAIDANAKLK